MGLMKQMEEAHILKGEKNELESKNKKLEDDLSFMSKEVEKAQRSEEVLLT